MGKIKSSDYIIFRIKLSDNHKKHYAQYQEVWKWMENLVEVALGEKFEWFVQNYGFGLSETVCELMKKHRGIIKSIHWDMDEWMIPRKEKDLVDFVTKNPPPYSYTIKRTYTSWKEYTEDVFWQADRNFELHKNGLGKNLNIMTYEQKREENKVQGGCT